MYERSKNGTMKPPPKLPPVYTLANNTKEFWKKISLLNSKECSIPTLSNGSTVAATCLEKLIFIMRLLPGASNHSVPELTTSDIPNVPADDCPDNLLCTEEEVYMLLSSLDCTQQSQWTRQYLSSNAEGNGSEHHICCYQTL